MEMGKLLRCCLLFMALIVSGSALGDSLEPSGTLPVLHINTANSVPLPTTSKDILIDATCWIDVPAGSAKAGLGSEANPVALTIKGRGNWTWSAFDKKSYRLKFEKKQAVLGMARDRNFVLLAHPDDNYTGMLRNAVGFKLSRLLGMDYTPDFRPVEVVVNGEYMGLYMLTENVRVDKNRVNVVKQDDNDTVPEHVTGGWLVEIDNAYDDNQIRLPVAGTNLSRLFVTWHSPDTLSVLQHDYLYDQFQKIKDAVFTADKSSAEWQSLIDLDQLVRFYMVNEVIGNYEAFLGSFYLHKDRGQQAWLAGPVWDMGQAFTSGYEERLIYVDNPFQEHGLIDEIAKYPAFQRQVRALWKEVYPAVIDSIYQYVGSFAETIAAAQTRNQTRWPQYVSYDEATCAAHVKSFLDQRVPYLDGLWSDEGNGVSGPTSDIAPNRQVYTVEGMLVGDGDALPTLRPGIYIVKAGSHAKTIVIR